VVDEVLKHSPHLGLAPFPSELVSSLAAGAPMLRLLPSVHGTDGYFLASLERRV
jgi:16S rRNA C967 or C1407 C5-methylase (RsmB/RsmF family)